MRQIVREYTAASPVMGCERVDWLRTLIVVGYKLVLSLDIQPFKLLYLLPEGGREKREWPGWLVSLAILAAFQMQPTVKMDWMEGSEIL